MAKILCTKSSLSTNQIHFLRAHILKERLKAKEASGNKPTISNSSPPTSDFDDSGNESPLTSDSQNLERSSREVEQPSLVESSSAELLDPKSAERGKESSEQETSEDVAKQIESLQGHLDSLKAEKHRLFQQLKMVLHEEDEKRMKEMEQKQELEKSDFMSPLDPRLAQSSTLGKHPHPGSPTTLGIMGQPLMKKLITRGPLLPTPEGPYMRQGSTSGSYRHHSSSDSYHPPSTHPTAPYPGGPPPHHFPGPVTSAVQRTPYQDQRAPHQDVVHMQVHGTHPSPQITPQAANIAYIKQPQYQGVPMATNYPYSTSAPYANLPNSQSVVQLAYQPQPPQQQMAPPIPPQGYQGLPPPPPPPHDLHMPHQQVYAQPVPVSHEMMAQQATGQYHTHDAQPHPHYMTQGSATQMVTGGQVYSDLAPAQAYTVLAGSVQDPRQQKLLMEHQQRAGSPLKPPFTKQESHSGSPSARDRP